MPVKERITKRANEGFGIILALMLLAIVAIVGFIGWYMWQQKDESSSNPSEEVCSQSYPQQCTKDGKTYLKY